MGTALSDDVNRLRDAKIALGSFFQRKLPPCVTAADTTPCAMRNENTKQNHMSDHIINK